MGDRPYLNFKEIRQRVPFLGVLSHYGVEVRKVNHVQFRANKCPLPSHSNEKDQGTFYVNTEKNLFCCHSDSCKKNSNGGKASGNVLDFVQAMEGVQAYEAAAKLNDWYPDGMPEQKTARPNGGAGDDSGRGERPHAHNNPTTATPEVNHPLAFQLKDITPEFKMIQEKGISVETARKYGCGFFPGKGSMSSRVVFSLYENGALIGYAGRATQDGQEPKWKLPAGLRKSFVYGLEHCDPHKPLILCESFWGVLFFDENGMQAAAVMGTELTPEQETCLTPFKVIWLAFDNDEKGREATEKIAARLRKNHSVKISRLRE